MSHQIIHCQHCRTEVPEQAAHCPSCGQPMPRHLIPPGAVVGDDYQIVRLLGYGGMGEVYLAQHQLTGQQVAIKVLALHLAEEVDLRIRFLDEARILARLDHPNIVMLHNFKQEGSRMLLIMQYVDGIGLDHLLAREGPMHPERAALLFAPLCDALHHAHENDIVHRDIKPSNILVDKSGKARLTDFGIGKLTRGGANLTRTGTRVGTSWFMSPEQGMNRPADPRSDIYCLGVTLYNALSGRLPFYGESEYEVIKGHVELPPPPIYRSDHPFARAMEQIVMRALAKDPDERFQQGVEIRDALLDALAAYGEQTEVRGAGGTGVFAIHKVSGAPASAAGAARQAREAALATLGNPPAPGAPAAGASVHDLPTSVDPVYSVVTGEIRTLTPARGKNHAQPDTARGPGAPGTAAAPPHRTPPMPSRVGEAAPAAALQPSGAQEPYPPQTREPAPRAAPVPQGLNPVQCTPPRAPFTPPGRPLLEEADLVAEAASGATSGAPQPTALQPAAGVPAETTAQSGPAAPNVSRTNASATQTEIATPTAPAAETKTAPLGAPSAAEPQKLGLSASFGEAGPGGPAAPAEQPGQSRTAAVRANRSHREPGARSEPSPPLAAPRAPGAAAGPAGASQQAPAPPAARRQTSPFGEPALSEPSDNRRGKHTETIRYPRPDPPEREQ